MAVIDELSRRATRARWLLEIDGIAERFFSGEPPAATAVAAPYVARPGVVRASASEQTLDVRRGIVEDGSASVSIAITRSNSAGSLLLRVVAEREATLAASVAASTGPTLVEVEEDLAGWPLVGVLWIGQEAMAYSGRTAVAPWQFTINAGDRGFYGSQIQEHTVDAAENWAPKVTDSCVAWRGRRARLKVAAGRPGGSTPSADYLVEVEGRLDASPNTTDNLTIDLTIVPDTSRLSQEVGGEELETQLQHGWHAWDMAGSQSLAGPRLEWPESGLWESRADTTLAIPAATVLVGVDDEEPLSGLDLVDLAGGQTLTVQWSGVGQPRGPGNRMAITGSVAGAVPPSGTVTIPAGTVGNLIAGEIRSLENPPLVEQDTVDLSLGGFVPGPVVTRWPAPQIEAFHAALAPGSILGAGGRRVDYRLLLDDEDGPALHCRILCRSHRLDPEIVIRWERLGAWYGLDLRDPSTLAPNNLYAIHGGNLHRLGAWPERREEVHRRGDAGEAVVKFPIRGVANAYHQNSERWIHVVDDVFRSPTVAQPVKIRARWTEGDEELTTRTWITQVVAAGVYTAGAPGYLLRVRERSLGAHLSFGDWGREGRTTIRELVGWTGATPGRILLDLLLSGAGNGINHPTYDRLPYGLNLSASAVDVDGVEAFQAPAVANSQTLEIEDAVVIEDLLGPMLRLSGAFLVHRLDRVTGARPLTLVPFGPPVVDDVASTHTDGSWSVEQRPTSETDEDVVNLVTYLANWSDDESALTVRVVDGDSRGRFGLVGQEEEIRGVSLPADDPVAHRARLSGAALAFLGEVANPRRVVRAVLPASDALLLDCGAVVRLTIADVYDSDGSLGVSGALGRVVSVRRDHDAGEAEIGVRLYPTTATGWAPALRVFVVVSAVEVEVVPNYYTAAAHPVTGLAQQDLQYWSAGDVARAVPAGNYAASVAGLAVASVNLAANRIVFGAAHGLVPGDSVRPDDYAAASTTHQGYAFLADDALGLGPAPDPAKRYA